MPDSEIGHGGRPSCQVGRGEVRLRVHATVMSPARATSVCFLVFSSPLCTRTHCSGTRPKNIPAVKKHFYFCRIPPLFCGF